MKHATVSQPTGPPPDLWGRQFRTLERRLSGSRGGARADLRRRLAGLERRRRVVERRLREAAHGPRLDWEDVRDEWQDTLGDVRRLAIDVQRSMEGA